MTRWGMSWTTTTASWTRTSNDIATEDYVDEKVEVCVDDKLFSVLMDIVLKCFERSAKTWMDDIRLQGVNKYKEELEAKKEEEEVKI